MMRSAIRIRITGLFGDGRKEPSGCAPYRKRISRPSVRFRFLILLLTALLQGTLCSQDLHQKITLKAHRKPLKEVLEDISRRTGINFSYNSQSVPGELLVNLNVRNRPADETLHDLLQSHGLTYSVVEKQVVIRPVVELSADQGPVGKKNKKHFTLYGFLYDKGSGEALIGANVYLKGTGVGTVTNGYGFYSLTLTEGPCRIIYSYLGFQEVKKNIELNANTRLSLEMEETNVDMKEVEIIAEESGNNIHNLQMSGFRFNRKSLSRLPGFAGDLDFLKALQAVPGIQTYGDGSALYYVRGGNCDQNLLLLDEVPIYNPAHLFGFFSAFSPDAINEVQVYKGDFPARYGGRLSSVIDIKAREGNMKQFGFSGNIGPYATSLTAEGPIVKNRGSFFLSGRLSSLDWMNYLSIFENEFYSRFFDINAKLNYIIDDKNRLFLTGYTGKDMFSRFSDGEVNASGIRWQNAAATLRWNHLFNNRLFSNTTLNYSHYSYTLDLPQEQQGSWNSSISNMTLKTDFTWYLNPANTLRSGLEITWHQTNPGNVISGTSDPSPAPEVSRTSSFEYVWYLSNEQRIGNRIMLRYGLRLPVWQDIGPSTVYYFNQTHQVIDTIHYGNLESYSVAFSPEPRVSIQFVINKRANIKASYSRTTQFLQLLSTSTSPFTSLDIWIPCGPNIPPQTADQVALGYFREFPVPGLTFTVEGYYKWFHDHPDYRDHANLLFNPLIEGELRFGTARSYGVELMLRKNTGKFTGWIGYTWSRAFAETPEINGGQSYPLMYDRPHNVSINLSFDDKKHWSFSAGWIFLSGAATTTPVGFYYYNGYSVPLYGDRNNDRLPAYHRLDLSATYIFNKPGNRYQHSLALTLYNVYGRLNPFSVNFNKMISDAGNFVVPANLEGNYELVPTTISVAGIIPSVNYIFKF